MNELQMYLLAIGVVVVLAVLIFNRWQERKYRRQAEQNFASSHDDVLLDESSGSERLEPMLEDEQPGEAEEERHESPEPASAQDVAAPWTENEATESVVEPVAAQDIPEPTPAEPRVSVGATPHAAEHASAPDAATEYIATLSVGDPVTAHALILVLQQLRSVGKAVRWLGQCDHENSWEEVFHASPSTEFVKLAACLQKADRNGPLSLGEINAFCDMAQAVAAHFYAVIDCPDKQKALAMAKELDQFCADVDVLIGVNIISKNGSPFIGTKLRALAESAGMRLMQDGHFHYCNDKGATLFSFGNLEPTLFSPENMKQISTHGVTFVFDVPKATGGLQAFNQMLTTARQFTTPLSALMVDDNRKELTDAGIDKIRLQLTAIYATMEKHGIHPGGSQASRLFS